MPTTHALSSGGLYSRVEAARYLKMSLRRMDELIRTGAINALRDGRSVKITGTELERYIADLPAYAEATA